MPRQARIDTPGADHHIIVRGIERRKIFIDDQDREAFIDQLGRLLNISTTAVSKSVRQGAQIAKAEKLKFIS